MSPKACIAEIVVGITGVKPSRILRPEKKRSTVRARSLLCFWATRELGIILAKLARRISIPLSSISMSVHCGEQIAEREGHLLLTELKLKNRRTSPFMLFVIFCNAISKIANLEVSAIPPRLQIFPFFIC